MNILKFLVLKTFGSKMNVYSKFERYSKSYVFLNSKTQVSKLWVLKLFGYTTFEDLQVLDICGYSISVGIQICWHSNLTVLKVCGYL